MFLGVLVFALGAYLVSVVMRIDLVRHICPQDHPLYHFGVT